MAIADWTIGKISTATAGLDTITPIVDAGSLGVRAAAGGWNGVWTYRNNIAQRGRILGVIRTLMRKGGSGTAGIYCMAQNLDLENGSPREVYLADITSAGVFEIKRNTFGLTSSSGSIVATGPTEVWSAGNVRAIELEWIYDDTEFGGVKFIFRAGPIGDLTFNSLTTKIDTVDNSATLLSTSVAEGLFTQNFNPAALPDTHFDESEMFDLAAA